MSWLELTAVFFAVFTSHVIPFIPLPGYLATITYVAVHRTPVELILAALATALGAALGKIVVFLYGYGVGKIVMRNELEYAKKFFRRISKWGIDVAVFIFAISPLADDVLYIPLGAAGYSIKRFFAVVLAGKLVLALIIVFAADLTTTLVEEFTGSTWLSMAVMAIITILATFLVLRIKWSKVLEAYEAGGMREAIKAMLKSIGI